MSISTAALVVLLTSSSALAALAPYWESAREIAALLKSNPVSDALHSMAPIREIKRTTDGYRITLADSCFAKVKIKQLPPADGKVGPVDFDIQIVQAACPKKSG